VHRATARPPAEATCLNGVCQLRLDSMRRTQRHWRAAHYGYFASKHKPANALQRPRSQRLQGIRNGSHLLGAGNGRCSTFMQDFGAMPQLEVRGADDAHAIGIWNTTLIQIWRGAVNLQSAQHANEVAMQLIASCTAAPTSLYIVEPTSPPPPLASRAPLATFSRDISAQMALSVIVAEGGGFRSAGVRAVGVALTTLLPHRISFEFETTVEAAAQRFEPHLGVGIQARDLVRAAEELRANMTSSSDGRQRTA